MDWSNEDYVRLYTRDTDDWLVMPWQSRCVLPLMMRKMDRAGVIETRRGARGIAAMIGVPAEIAEEGVRGLLEDGCLVENDLGYVMQNFVSAQTAKKSDRQRQRDSRDKRRALALAREVHDQNGHSVTNRDSASLDVTEGHYLSQQVTTCHSPVADPIPIPLRCVPVVTRSPTDATLAWRLWLEHCDRHERLRRELEAPIPSLLRLETAQGYRDLRDRLRESGEQCEQRARHALDVREAESIAKRSLEWFGDSVWRQDQFTAAMRMDPAKVGKPQSKAAGPQPPASRKL